MLVAHDALVGGLDDEDRDQFVREWNDVAALMGVPRGQRFPSRVALGDYVAREIRSGWIAPGRGSREVADTVLAPPLPSVMAVPAWRLVTFVTLGLLPAELRAGYRIPWTPLRRCRSSRSLLGVARRASGPTPANAGLAGARLGGTPGEASGGAVRASLQVGGWEPRRDANEWPR